MAAPFSFAPTAMSPSREGTGLLGSITTLPFSCAPTCCWISGSALYGTAMRMASPNATACSTLPLRPRGPAPSAARFACSGSRSENITSCPAFAHKPPNVEPMRPEPITPIFMGLVCVWANAGIDTAPASDTAAASATTKARRFIRALLRFSLSRLQSIHGLAQKGARRVARRELRSRRFLPGQTPHPHEEHSFQRREAPGHRRRHVADLRRGRRCGGAPAARRSAEAARAQRRRLLAHVRLERVGGRRADRPAWRAG